MLPGLEDLTSGLSQIHSGDAEGEAVGEEGDLNHSHFSFVQLRKHLLSEAVLGSYSLPGCLDKAQSAVSFPASENCKRGSGA